MRLEYGETSHASDLEVVDVKTTRSGSSWRNIRSGFRGSPKMQRLTNLVGSEHGSMSLAFLRFPICKHHQHPLRKATHFKS